MRPAQETSKNGKRPTKRPTNTKRDQHKRPTNTNRDLGRDLPGFLAPLFIFVGLFLGL